MPYLICPGCGLTVYSAVAYSTSGPCPECERSLEGAERSTQALQRWALTDLRPSAPEAQHGAR